MIQFFSQDLPTIGRTLLFNGLIYERTKVENDYNPASTYQAGEKVYHKGFVYESDQLSSFLNGWKARERPGATLITMALSLNYSVNLETARVD